jgi:hypothetical protein
MPSAEYFIITGMILVGIIFFFIAQTFLFKESEEVKRLGIKAESEEIASFIYRISKDPAPYLRYCQLINLANITIEKSMLKYERGGYEFFNILPPNVSDTKLIEVAQFCIVKRDSKIEVLGEVPVCELNGFCTLEECKEDCPDCYGPASICVNDAYCNLAIKENCANSPKDCNCTTFGNYICCSTDPKANEYGCVNESRQNLNKGEECFCDNECKAGLKCNPTAPAFTAYKKACCEPGKMWNGSECIITECKYPCVPGCELPKKWDWRNVDGINYLNPVRNQGHCGSCWAFSAVGAVEGTYNVENNCPACNKDLSEQNLVSNDAPCCNYCGSCNGGSPINALYYFKNSGVVDEGCCPYFSSSYDNNTVANCPLCLDYLSRRWKISSFGAISSNLDDIKMAVVCYGPLSVASMNWQHAIVLVGYDDNTQKWIIRNSWGSGWGDGGYGYIPYSGHPYSDLKNYVYYVEEVQTP